LKTLTHLKQNANNSHFECFITHSFHFFHVERTGNFLKQCPFFFPFCWAKGTANVYTLTARVCVYSIA